MKTQKQLNRKTVKDAAEIFSLIYRQKKIVSDGLDLSKYKDDEIPDGYIFMHAECEDSIEKASIIKLAKSLRIKRIVQAKPKHVSFLLGLSKKELNSNNIFFAIETKNGLTQVVMFWKSC